MHLSQKNALLQCDNPQGCVATSEAELEFKGCAATSVAII